MSPSRSQASDPVVLMRDSTLSSGRWLRFGRPLEILVAQSLDQVEPLLEALERASGMGAWGAGFVSYEAAPAFDRVYRAQTGAALPFAWFGLFDPPTVETSRRLRGEGAVPADGSWHCSISEIDYRSAVSRIRDLIARGDTYQGNFTFRLAADYEGRPEQLFTAMWRNQRAPYSAFLETDQWAICSASPELFFERRGSRIVTRPMKGTAPRGLTTGDDEARARRLLNSVKDRAENIMIVDMLRNDLSKIARPGTVEASRLLSLERYPSVLQLTSTVEAETDASLPEIFAALFPCASVTGAPKVRTMEILSRLEDSPRGVYTGAIGFVAPDRQAQFNVAIRTAVIDSQRSKVEFGTGSGVVWDSDPEQEWRECLLKARVLSAGWEEMALLETLLWESGTGFSLLGRHLDRLADSARYFDIPFLPQRAKEKLWSLSESFDRSRRVVRLLLDLEGGICLEERPLEPLKAPWRVALDSLPVDRNDLFLYHKTTRRRTYGEARARFPAQDDVLLWNDRGELTESTVANLVVRLRGRLFTPPVECGLLAGTMRAELLERGEIEERRLPVEVLDQAEELFLVNSVRGWIPARLEIPGSGARARADATLPAPSP